MKSKSSIKNNVKNNITSAGTGSRPVLHVLNIALGLIVVAAVASGVVYVATNPNALTKDLPLMFSQIQDKLNSIITPNAPIGNLTPVRDLTGTWVSSLSGKGIQLYGKLSSGSTTTLVYETGDIELKIDSVVGNTASGTMRMTNTCSWGTATSGGKTVSVPKQCIADSGANPITIRISGSRLDFGTIKYSGGSATMQGTYTTSLMSGSMTASTPYGVIKGQFNLKKFNNTKKATRR